VESLAGCVGEVSDDDDLSCARPLIALYKAAGAIAFAQLTEKRERANLMGFTYEIEVSALDTLRLLRPLIEAIEPAYEVALVELELARYTRANRRAAVTEPTVESERPDDYCSCCGEAVIGDDLRVAIVETVWATDTLALCAPCSDAGCKPVALDTKCQRGVGSTDA